MPRPRTNRAITSQMKPGAKAEASAPTIMITATHGVDPLAAEHVGDPSEDERAEEGPQDGGAGHPTGLERAQVPLGGHDGRHGADDEQVVGVGEEADPGHHDGAAVELAPGSLVQEVG